MRENCQIEPIHQLVLEQIEKKVPYLTAREKKLVEDAARLGYSFASFDFLKAAKKSLEDTCSDLLNEALKL